MHVPEPNSAADSHGQPRLAVQYLVHTFILFLCAGALVPGVNESHYLPKAKHAWDASYAAGGDLFLQSHDSHYLATSLAGLAAAVLPLAAVAMIGRIVSWIFLAIAWVRLTQQLGMRWYLRPLALIAWFLATEYGNWAGEWAVGGFEAKTLAYPCILMGLAARLQNRWGAVWIWLGLAVAWHPLVGGWAGLSVGIPWLFRPKLGQRLAEQWPWLLLATGVGGIGVLPAATGLGGPDLVGNVSAAQVHVFLRLAHHLCPQTFAFERHLAAAASLALFAMVTLVWLRYAQPSIRQRTQPLLSLAGMSLVFSLMGLLIDVTLSEARPDIASKLLRFYWFRWSDIAVPLAGILTFSMLVQQFAYGANPRPGTQPSPRGNYALMLLLLSVGAFFSQHIWSGWQQTVPEADRLVVDVDGRYEIRSNRYVDWLAACAWIRDNTPSDSLWLTPKYQQTFKWHAARAEVVCWKDIPQDNASVLAWYERIQRCDPPRDKAGKIRDWKTEELLALSDEYGFEWVLLDRAFQADPPRLEIVYPIDIENRSFAICRIRRSSPPPASTP